MNRQVFRVEDLYVCRSCGTFILDGRCWCCIMKELEYEPGSALVAEIAKDLEQEARHK